MGSSELHAGVGRGAIEKYQQIGWDQWRYERWVATLSAIHLAWLGMSGMPSGVVGPCCYEETKLFGVGKVVGVGLDFSVVEPSLAGIHKLRSDYPSE